MGIESFGIEKPFLQDLLKETRDGKLQLPEFQRGWVWPDRNVASLLASVSLAYPIGTLMVLQTGGEGVRFKQRPVEGAEDSASGAKAEGLILDGQQRVTSLFQALMLDRPVHTQDVRKKPVDLWFYIDMVKALNPNVDREDAIVTLPPDKKVKSFRGEVQADYTTANAEYAAHLFPLNKVLDADAWEVGYQQHWDYAKDRIQFWQRFRSEVIDAFRKYLVPVIKLGAGTKRQAVCQVFEKVNTGGVTLTVFELLTATYAADEFDLRRDWSERERGIKRSDSKILTELANTDFLQVISLLATREAHEAALAGGENADRAPRIGCKRTDMLALELPAYEKWAPLVVQGLRRAAQFLHKQFLYETRFLPYGGQLVPLAAILTLIGDNWDRQGTREKLERWYWCGVFGELYGGTTETRFSRDLPEVVAWIKGGPEPRTITEANFAPARLLTLRTRGSAAYKGIYALLLKEGAVDWRTGVEATIQNYFDDAIDIHHVFPKDWCEKRGIDVKRLDSIVNKTPLSARTNRAIGGKAPSEYLPRVANGAGISIVALEENTRTHFIESSFLRADDFDGFFLARSAAILGKIEQAMGKQSVALPTEADDLEVPSLEEEIGGLAADAEAPAVA